MSFKLKLTQKSAESPGNTGINNSYWDSWAKTTKNTADAVIDFCRYGPIQNYRHTTPRLRVALLRCILLATSRAATKVAAPHEAAQQRSVAR